MLRPTEKLDLHHVEPVRGRHTLPGGANLFRIERHILKTRPERPRRFA